MRRQDAYATLAPGTGKGSLPRRESVDLVELHPVFFARTILMSSDLNVAS
jgi:hypothetical protein